jgi:hypothetical protein
MLLHLPKEVNQKSVTGGLIPSGTCFGLALVLGLVLAYSDVVLFTRTMFEFGLLWPKEAQKTSKITVNTFGGQTCAIRCRAFQCVCCGV